MAYEPIVDRVMNIDSDGKVVRYIKAKVDSTDYKPIDGIFEGSSLYEKDTGKLYLFNEKKKKWIVPDDFEPGSGSGSSSFVCFPINSTIEGLILSKTWQEIYDYLRNGVAVGFIESSEEDSDMFCTFYLVNGVSIVDNFYTVGLIDGSIYVAASPSDYPNQQK